jgi:superfamily II DNA/RNA helicase
LAVERTGGGGDVAHMRTFSDIKKRLPVQVAKNVALMQYKEPTPIQAHAVPLALANAGGY